MANSKRIAASRQNARKSTGPRSAGGKKRASRNAYRHGLAASSSSLADFAAAVDSLARKIAGNGTQNIFQYARLIAEAELDLERVRRTKIAVIEQARAFVSIDSSNGDYLARPSEELDTTVQALQHSLPILERLQHYERRAVSRRDRAVRNLACALLLARKGCLNL
jgi:hypothetical protein